MPDDPASRNPKAIWQKQKTETSKMTPQLIHSKAQDLQGKTQRQMLGTFAGPVAALLLYIVGEREFRPLERILHLLFASALAWSVVGLYFLSRGIWRSGLRPYDAGLTSGLDFCRQEIARRQILFRRVLLWSFGPILLAITTFILALARIASNRILPNGLPFLILVAIWIIAYFVIRFREQRALDRELDELNGIERQNSARGDI
jgi:hypothetical protein